MGPTWGPSGPHVGPMNFAIWDVSTDLYNGDDNKAKNTTTTNDDGYDVHDNK